MLLCWVNVYSQGDDQSSPIPNEWDIRKAGCGAGGEFGEDERVLLILVLARFKADLMLLNIIYGGAAFLFHTKR